MAIARVTSAGAGNVGATTLVLDPAATPSERDLVICCVSVRGGTGTSIKWNVSFQQAGLTNPTVNSTTVLRQAIYWRWAGANEPTSYTATFSSSQKASGSCLVFSGVDMAQPFDVSSGQANASSTTITAAGITVATAGCWLVGFFGTAVSDTISTYSSPLAEQTDAQSTVSTNTTRTTTAGADSNGTVSTGATGNKTAVAATTAAVNIGHLLAIRPRTDGTTFTKNVGSSSDDAVATNIGLALSITDTEVSLGERGTSNVSGMRFNAVTVANAATINWAYVLVRAVATYTPAHATVIETDLSCEAADDAATFTTAGTNLSTAARPRTTAKTTDWRLHDVVVSIDEVLPITSAVQEVINRAGWSSGNDLVVLGDNSGSTGAEWQGFASFDHATILEPRLVINYTAAAGGVTVDLVADPATAASSAVTPTVVQASLTLNLTAVVAVATSSAVSPTVLQGSLTINATASPATAAGTAIDPTVSITGGGVTVNLTSLPASAASSAVTPTVVQSSVTVNASAVVAAAVGTAITPTITITGGRVTVDATSVPATATSSAVSPTVRQASITLNLTASPATAVSSAVTPTVTLSGGGVTVNLTAVPASAVGSAVSPSVVQGSVVVTPAPSIAISSAITPTVRQASLSVNLAALPALAIGTAITPTTTVAAAAARATGQASGRPLLLPVTASRIITLPRTSGRITLRPSLTARARTGAATSGHAATEPAMSGSEHK
jgi:hypothetical protein